jgi:hypothetical protein
MGAVICRETSENNYQHTCVKSEKFSGHLHELCGQAVDTFNVKPSGLYSYHRVLQRIISEQVRRCHMSNLEDGVRISVWGY